MTTKGMTAKSMTARDLMQTDLVTVATHTPLDEIEQVLADHGIGGVPVTDAKGHLCGLVSIRDVVAFRAAEEGRDDDPPPMRERTGATAADLMTADVHAVAADASVAAVAREMLDRRIHRVLVRDDSGRHVGLISSFDLLALLADRPASRS